MKDDKKPNKQANPKANPQPQGEATPMIKPDSATSDVAPLDNVDILEAEPPMPEQAIINADAEAEEEFMDTPRLEELGIDPEIRPEERLPEHGDMASEFQANLQHSEDPVVQEQIKQEQERNIAQSKININQIKDKTMDIVKDAAEKIKNSVEESDIGETLRNRIDESQGVFTKLANQITEKLPFIKSYADANVQAAKVMALAAEKTTNGLLAVAPNAINLLGDLGVHNMERGKATTVNELVNMVAENTGLKEKYGLGKIEVTNPEWRKNLHWSEQLIIEVAPFLFGYLGLRGLLGIAGNLKRAQQAAGLKKAALYGGFLTKEMAVNGLVDGLISEKDQGNLANFLSRYPVFRDTFMEALAVDEDDSELEQRFKNAAIGAGLAGVFEIVFIAFGKFLVKSEKIKTSPSGKITKDTLKEQGIESSEDIANKIIDEGQAKPKEEPKPKEGEAKPDEPKAKEGEAKPDESGNVEIKKAGDMKGSKIPKKGELTTEEIDERVQRLIDAREKTNDPKVAKKLDKRVKELEKQKEEIIKQEADINPDEIPFPAKDPTVKQVLDDSKPKKPEPPLLKDNKNLIDDVYDPYIDNPVPSSIDEINRVNKKNGDVYQYSASQTRLTNRLIKSFERTGLEKGISRQVLTQIDEYMEKTGKRIDLDRINTDNLATYYKNSKNPSVEGFLNTAQKAQTGTGTKGLSATLKKDGEKFIKTMENLIRHSEDIGKIKSQGIDEIIKIAEDIKKVIETYGENSLEYARLLHRLNKTADLVVAIVAGNKPKSRAIGAALENLKADRWQEGKLLQLRKLMKTDYTALEKAEIKKLMLSKTGQKPTTKLRVIGDKDHLLTILENPHIRGRKQVNLILSYIEKHKKIFEKIGEGPEAIIKETNPTKSFWGYTGQALYKAADVIGDLGVFTILSGIKTRFNILWGTGSQLVFDVFDDITEDLLGMSRLGIKKIRGKSTADIPRESFFWNKLNLLYLNLGKSFRDAGDYITNKRTIQEIRGQDADEMEHLFDYHQKSPYVSMSQYLREQEAFKQGKALARVGVVVSELLEVMHGLKVVKGLDVFFESLVRPAKVYENVVHSIRSKYIDADVGLDASQKIELEQAIQQEVKDTFSHELDNALNGNFKSEIQVRAKNDTNAIMYRDRSADGPLGLGQALIKGGQYLQKDPIRPIGKFFSVFSTLSANVMHHLVARSPMLRLSPKIRESIERFGGWREYSRAINGTLLGIGATTYYLNTKKVFIPKGDKERRHTQQALGHYVNDIAYLDDRDVAIEGKDGTLYNIDAGSPAGAIITMYMRAWNNLQDINDGGVSMARGLADLVLDITTSMTSADFFNTHTKAIEFLQDVYEGKDIGLRAIDRFMHAGIFKEVEDVRRGFRTARKPIAKGQIKDDFTTEKWSPNFRITHTLEGTDLYSRDNGNVPAVDFLGEEVKHFRGNARSRFGIGSIVDIWNYLRGHKPIKLSPLRLEVYDLYEEFDRNSPEYKKAILDLYPDDSFRLSDILNQDAIAWVDSIYGGEGEAIDVLKDRPSINYKRALGQTYRFNDFDVSKIRRLNGGKKITVRMKGVEEMIPDPDRPGKMKKVQKAIQVDPIDTAKTFVRLDPKAFKGGTGFREQAQHWKSHFARYGYDKPSAMKAVMINPQIDRMRIELQGKYGENFGDMPAPLREKTIKEYVHKNLKQVNVRATGKSPLGEGLDYDYAIAKIQHHFDDNDERRAEQKKSMIAIVSELSSPYNSFSKALYTDTIYRANPDFSKVFLKAFFERMDRSERRTTEKRIDVKVKEKIRDFKKRVKQGGKK